MASEFITRVEHGKDEPYTVIFRTDDADKYKHIEDECRRMIGHEKPTVDAVPVVRCRDCKWAEVDAWWTYCKLGHKEDTTNSIIYTCTHNFYCADGERRTE